MHSYQSRVALVSEHRQRRSQRGHFTGRDAPRPPLKRGSPSYRRSRRSGPRRRSRFDLGSSAPSQTGLKAEVRATALANKGHAKGGVKKSGAALWCSPRIALCDQPRRQGIVPCCAILHRADDDDGFKTAVTFPAPPQMTILLPTPVLGPFGSNQLIVALNTAHAEARTTCGYHRRHSNLPAVVPRQTNIIMKVDFATSLFSLKKHFL